MYKFNPDTTVDDETISDPVSIEIIDDETAARAKLTKLSEKGGIGIKLFKRAIPDRGTLLLDTLLKNSLVRSKLLSYSPHCDALYHDANAIKTLITKLPSEFLSSYTTLVNGFNVFEVNLGESVKLMPDEESSILRFAIYNKCTEGTLRNMIARNVDIDIEKLLQDIISALKMFHSRGLSILDLNLDNIA